MATGVTIRLHNWRTEGFTGPYPNPFFRDIPKSADNANMPTIRLGTQSDLPYVIRGMTQVLIVLLAVAPCPRHCSLNGVAGHHEIAQRIEGLR